MEDKINKSEELTLEEIDRRLEGRVPGYKIHQDLLPLKLFKLYHKLKPEYAIPKDLPDDIRELYQGSKSEIFQNHQYLKCFKRWEIEVSKRIAGNFYEYLPNSPADSNIRIKFNKHLGWIRDQSSWIGTDENTMKFYKVFNYYMHTSHTWLIESSIFSSKDYLGIKNLLIEINAPEESLNELDEVFPKFLVTHGTYNPSSKFAGEQFDPSIKKSIAHLLQSFVNNKNVAINEIPLIFPFINVERLVLYFWLEQSVPDMTPIMLLSKLINDEDMEQFSWDVFIVWLWNIQIIVSNKKEISKRSIQDQILSSLSNLTKNKTGKRTYGEYNEHGWTDFSSDNDTGIKNLKKLRAKMTIAPNYNINYKLPSLELLNKILQ